jgi:Holliday junction resolvasome RuvABC endonuclease subunit
MSKNIKNIKNTKIIGISPGTRYIGYAIFYDSELRDWGIKNIEGRWSNEKQKRIMAFISDMIGQHKPNVLSVKSLHPSRSSPNLNKLVSRIKEISKRKRLRIHQYSIKELESFFYQNGRINKRALTEKVAEKYSVLSHELNREKTIRNPYYIRMFEAVALGSLCLYQLDRHIKTRTSSHHKNHVKKQSKNTCH